MGRAAEWQKQAQQHREELEQKLRMHKVDKPADDDMSPEAVSWRAQLDKLESAVLLAKDGETRLHVRSRYGRLAR